MMDLDRSKWEAEIDRVVDSSSALGEPTDAVFDRVIDRVCRMHDVARKALLGPLRRADLWRARRDAWLALKRLGFSQSEIARRFGRHSSSLSTAIGKRRGAL